MNLTHAQGQLLAQVRPGVATAVNLFTADQLGVEITLILACIVPGGTSPNAVKIYHDVDGTTYDTTNVLIHSTRTELTQDTVLFQAQHPGSGILLRPGDSLGCEAATANNVVFSVYGISEHVAERFGSKNV